MIRTLTRSDSGALKLTDLPGDADVGGDGMEYIPHSMMVCTGIITIVGLLYSHWFCESISDRSVVAWRGRFQILSDLAG